MSILLATQESMPRLTEEGLIRLRVDRTLQIGNTKNEQDLDCAYF